MTLREAYRGGAGTTVSLGQILAAKDRRAARQAAALARFGKPLVSMSIVMPGPVKDGWPARRALSVGLHEFNALSAVERWPALSREVSWDDTGPEALLVLDVEARSLKAGLVKLEDSHPIGRLWDFDVVTVHHGGLSRRDLGHPARRCLVCERPSHECGRSRRHPLSELLAAIRTMVETYDPHATA